MCAAVDDARFVGGHPMAGSELEGLDGADGTMFNGAVWVLTPGPRTADATLSAVAGAVALLGAEMVAMTPERHDEMVAVVSHVPAPHRGQPDGPGRRRRRGARRAAAPGRRRVPRHDPHRQRPPRHLARHLRAEPPGHRRRARPPDRRAERDAGDRQRDRSRGPATSACSGPVPPAATCPAASPGPSSSPRCASRSPTAWAPRPRSSRMAAQRHASTSPASRSSTSPRATSASPWCSSTPRPTERYRAARSVEHGYAPGDHQARMTAAGTRRRRAGVEEHRQPGPRRRRARRRREPSSPTSPTATTPRRCVTGLDQLGVEVVLDGRSCRRAGRWRAAPPRPRCPHRRRARRHDVAVRHRPRRRSPTCRWWSTATRRCGPGRWRSCTTRWRRSAPGSSTPSGPGTCRCEVTGRSSAAARWRLARRRVEPVHHRADARRPGARRRGAHRADDAARVRALRRASPPSVMARVRRRRSRCRSARSSWRPGATAARSSPSSRTRRRPATRWPWRPLRAAR